MTSVLQALRLPCLFRTCHRYSVAPELPLVSAAFCAPIPRTRNATQADSSCRRCFALGVICSGGRLPSC